MSTNKSESAIALSGLTAAILTFSGCGSATTIKDSYIANLESENNISYSKIINTRGAYITSMCYTKTEDKKTDKVSNPCYSCHTKGTVPNYYNDTNLQKEYNFPPEVMKNPFKNLFKDRSEAVSKIDDETILSYVRESNYFDENGSIVLAKVLPKEWKGYRPDCYFNFDEEGFDKTPDGDYTLWRAFRYYPFLGTFWPTNGSTDDVMIRLAPVFSQNSEGVFNISIYKLNLSIVESLIKQKDIVLSAAVDEKMYGVDLNQNGILDEALEVKIATYEKMSYVGKAKEALESKKIHLALGLFPQGTEFLHSVRYLDYNTKEKHVDMAQRMKELRYGKKVSWSTYSDIERAANSELFEAQINGTEQGVMATFRGNYEEGLKNEISWVYQGFIEDKNGDLRPQTHEETIGCMGCHSHLGATTDSIFAFARKFEGSIKTDKDYGWNHWLQKGIIGIKEPKVSYKTFAKQYEYSFYLQNNHSGNEFRNNDEVKEKFFDEKGLLKTDMIHRLHNDISTLLLPSKSRAMQLNKGYRVMVQEQSFIYGRDANVKPMSNVLKELKIGDETGVVNTIVR